MIKKETMTVRHWYAPMEYPMIASTDEYLVAMKALR